MSKINQISPAPNCQQWPHWCWEGSSQTGRCSEKNDFTISNKTWCGYDKLYKLQLHTRVFNVWWWKVFRKVKFLTFPSWLQTIFFAPSSEVSAQTIAFTENTVLPSLSATTWVITINIWTKSINLPTSLKEQWTMDICWNLCFIFSFFLYLLYWHMLICMIL